jgi:hypothetical protein
MNPECQRFVERIAALSADDLSPAEAEAVRRHLEECPPCKGQLVLFERTLFTLSSTSQPLLSARRSRQMWLVCLEHARAEKSGSHPLPVEPASSGADSKANLWESFSKSFGWLAGTPRWGWALAGGAATVMTAAYLLAPQPQTPGAGDSSLAAMPLPQGTFVAFSGPGRGNTFEVPSPSAAQLVDYHTAMNFEPYTDHVGPSLVAYTSTLPQSLHFTVPDDSGASQR